MKKDDRVGAFCYTDHKAKIIVFFGYGVFLGETLPSEDVVAGCVRVSRTGRKSATVKLDSGDKVYRCECEDWALEENAQNYIKDCTGDGYKLKQITVKEYRREAAETLNNSLFRDLT